MSRYREEMVNLVVSIASNKRKSPEEKLQDQELIENYLIDIIRDQRYSETEKIETINFLINKKVELKYLDWLVLKAVVEHKYENLAKILINHGVNIGDCLPLISIAGYTELVSLIVNRGIELRQNDKDLLSYYSVNGQIKILLSKAIYTDELFDGIFTKEQSGISLSNQTKPNNHLSSSQKVYHEYDKELVDSNSEMSINYSLPDPLKKVTKEVPFKGHSLSSGIRLDIEVKPFKKTIIQTINNSFVPRNLFENSEKRIHSSEEKSKMLSERFNAILSKKVSNIFKSYIGQNEEFNQKAKVENIVNSLHNLFEKVINNFKQASFFEKNDQVTSIAEEIFNSNDFLKLYFGDFNDFSSENSIPSSKVLVVIELLFYQYTSASKNNMQIDIESNLVNYFEENPNNITHSSTEKCSLIDECTFEYVSREQSVLSESQLVTIGENTPDPI